jgi:hypothetical protein
MGGSNNTTSSGSQNSIQDTINQMISGQTLTGNAASTLGGIQNFETNAMNNGLSPAVQQQALQQNQTQDQQSINNIMHSLGAGQSNAGGLAEDLGKQAIMGNAQTAAGLGAANQAAEQTGAQNLAAVTAQLNPNQSYNNSATQQQSNSSGTSSTTNTSNPGIGSFLGSMLSSGLSGLAAAGTGGASLWAPAAASGMSTMNPMNLAGAGTGGV